MKWQELKKRVRTRSVWRRIKYFVYHDLYWGFRHRFIPRNQYNVVRFPIPHGYYDIDYRLLHAVFELFKQHIELEREGLAGLEASIKYWREVYDKGPQGEEDYEFRYALPEAQRLENMRQIYVYWTQDRAKLEEEWGAIDIESRLYNKDNEMMKRIIDLREGLWT